MREELEAVVEDLRRRKAEGEKWVYLSEETLATVRETATQLRTAEARPSTPAVEPQTRREPPSHEALFAPAPKQTPATPPAPVAAQKTENNLPAPPKVDLIAGSKEEQWNWLREKVLSCPVCNSHIKPGKKVVFGVGNLDASIFFCGEAPGADEEILGEPFVGKAGQLLTKIIQAMGLSREQVYIGNIMNWRPELDTPTGNRPPTAEEMAFCLPYLKAQVEIVKPKVIVALGNTAISGLLGPDPTRRLGKIRGKWHDFNGVPLMPTYHPSYVLRYGSNTTKREIWEDMLAVMQKTGMPISEKQQAYFSQ